MKKKVGIIIDSLTVSNSTHYLIQLSKASDHYEISTLILNNSDKQHKNLAPSPSTHIKQRGFAKRCSKVFFRLICMLEKFIFRQDKKLAEPYQKHTLNETLFEIINANPLASKNGTTYHYTKEDISAIKSARLDLIVLGSNCILKGDILSACPNGVISLCYGDNTAHRGQPAGFWEVYEHNPRTGFSIQRLTEELNSGNVLYTGYVTTEWLYSSNLAKLQKIASPFLHRVIEDITAGKSVTGKKNTPYSFPRYTTPAIMQSTTYFCKTIFRHLEKRAYKPLGISHRWGVAYQFAAHWREAALWRSTKIPNPKNRFLADPFLIKKDGEHYCFVEDYDYCKNKGSISAYKITSSGHHDLGIVLEEDFHLSYPFLFEYNNEIYMCPETFKKEEIRIYKCIEFPTRWAFHKTLMYNVFAVDTNIFELNGKWWLLTNIDNSGFHDYGCQLHIFHSTHPLSDEWIAHDANPVIFDPRAGRNGGMIFDNDALYRVFQRQGFDMYGESAGIAKIKSLSPSSYEEEIVSEIHAKFFKNISGTHTYNYKEGLIVLDYVEMAKNNTGV